MGVLDVMHAAEGIQARMYRNAGFCPDVPAPIGALAAASRATIRMVPRVLGDGATTLRTRTIDVQSGLPRARARFAAARGLVDLALHDEGWTTCLEPLSYGAAAAVVAPRPALVHVMRGLLPGNIAQLASLFAMPQTAAALRLADVTPGARVVVAREKRTYSRVSDAEDVLALIESGHVRSLDADETTLLFSRDLQFVDDLRCQRLDVDVAEFIGRWFPCAERVSQLAACVH